MNCFLKYLHTVKYLKPSQIFWRFWIFVKKKRYRSKPISSDKIRINVRLMLPECHSAQRNSICIFGKILNPQLVSWNAAENSKLWQYHLHYFDYINTFDCMPGIELIHHWIDNNPPGKESGWDSYPISLRVVNWIKFIVKYEFQPDIKIIHSLHTQMHYLSAFREKHLLANHYFKNIVALLYLGYYLDNDKIFNISIDEIKKQMIEQSVNGLHFEFSPTYHVLFTKDLIDSYNLLRSNKLEKDLQKNIDTRIIAALNWVEHFSQNGRYIPVGDVNYQGCPNNDDLINNYLVVSETSYKVQKINQTDYFPKMEHMDFEIMLLNAPFNPSYNPAHSHCDKLSVLFWFLNIPVLVDTGNYDYENSEERKYSRSISAHNTIKVDDLEQADFWDVFRIGKRGKVNNTKQSNDGIQAAFQYQSYTHLRNIQKSDNGIVINDDVVCKGFHNYRLYFHINPTLESVIETNVLNIKELGIRIKLPGEDITVIQTDYYPAMYIKQRKLTIVAKGTFQNRMTLVTRISR